MGAISGQVSCDNSAAVVLDVTVMTQLHGFLSACGAAFTLSFLDELAPQLGAFVVGWRGISRC